MTRSRLARVALTLASAAAALPVGCDRPSPPSASVGSARPAAAPVEAGPPATSAATPAVDATVPATANVTRFDDETEGAPPQTFEPVVGDWSIGRVGDAKGLMVDGSKWRNGTPSVNLADQAKRLYGDRYAEFLDGVKTFAFYPLAVAKAPPPAGDVRLSVRFFPIAGTVDQAAGIAFDITPSGSYTAVRANALEDNLLFFTVAKGKRNVLDTVRGVPTPSRAWHTIVVEIRGAGLVVNVDGARRFERRLEAVPSGRVGIWSKADSKVLFDDFEVTPL